MASQPASTLPQADPAFGSILCGINGSRPSTEAARQAALLADPGSNLTYVSVSWERGSGTAAVATLSHEHARKYLRAARSIAHKLNVDATAVNEHAENAAHRLPELAGAHDLLAIGIHGHSRAGGIAIGNVATAALHRSPVPVLVARRPAKGVTFLDRIVLASDGSALSDPAAELTARIAARHGARVAIVAVRHHDAPYVPGLGYQAKRIAAVTGAEPEMIFRDVGPPHHGVAAAARDFGASLIVTGSRGLTRVASIRSVSERIAHAADCSVLVVR
jgi:nucleotide-binding universal stress UspA family protein